jgi:hypothetical protein
MKIILDTNIWYDIENNEIFKNPDLKSNITVTFLNYFELIKKPRIITDPDLFRKIFTKMDEYDKIFEPPFVYIAKLHNYYHYNVLIEQYDYINFLINFKKGDFIDPAKESDFREYVKEMDKDFEILANTYNEEALNIKAKIKNNKKHLISDSSKFTNEYLQFIVSKATKQNLEGFDFKNIQLFSETLDGFFKKMEVGELIMKTNDIVDYMMLSYVQPGDKYYTKDKKWIRLISDSNNSQYLYKEGI